MWASTAPHSSSVTLRLPQLNLTGHVTIISHVLFGSNYTCWILFPEIGESKNSDCCGATEDFWDDLCTFWHTGDLPHLPHHDRWGELQPTHNPELDIWKKMDKPMDTMWPKYVSLHNTASSVNLNAKAFRLLCVSFSLFVCSFVLKASGLNYSNLLIIFHHPWMHSPFTHDCQDFLMSHLYFITQFEHSWTINSLNSSTLHLYFFP